jgi:uncharacterized protein YegP (UPF0339 family)
MDGVNFWAVPCATITTSAVSTTSQVASGKYHFHLKAPNGEIIVASQGYATKANAHKGIEAIKTHAPDAKVEDLTGKKLPVPPAARPPLPSVACYGRCCRTWDT